MSHSSAAPAVTLTAASRKSAIRATGFPAPNSPTSARHRQPQSLGAELRQACRQAPFVRLGTLMYARRLKLGLPGSDCDKSSAPVGVRLDHMTRPKRPLTSALANDVSRDRHIAMIAVHQPIHDYPIAIVDTEAVRDTSPRTASLCAAPRLARGLSSARTRPLQAPGRRAALVHGCEGCVPVGAGFDALGGPH
jgi:hypothetical protein